MYDGSRIRQEHAVRRLLDQLVGAGVLPTHDIRSIYYLAQGMIPAEPLRAAYGWRRQFRRAAGAISPWRMSRFRGSKPVGCGGL
jgi:hypothetical protein